MIANDEAHFSATILVVDDDPLSVMIIEETLHSAGYRSVHSLLDPRDVIGFLRAQEPDLILLDITMPYLTGYEVIRLIDEEAPETFIPILMLTAAHDREARLKSLSLGAMDFITKPFEKAEMLTRIRNMITVRLLHKKVESQNANLERKVNERTRELHNTRLEIIRRLSRAAEYRDDDTGLHIERMSWMCARLGEAIGLERARVELILNASPMHDVGKIGIPDSILLKPGRFTPAERKVMETHTVIGAKLLEGHASELMRMARDIALTHHERWDGDGYPNGLEGDEIPLEGRIASLCDVFDALTSVRPYKHAWSVDETLAYIRESSGGLFDPSLVSMFLSITDDMVGIKREFDIVPRDPGAPPQ